jgi:N-acetylglucosaminyldiphosphoundecaprenol N-acetyl-beta-D-mannosaminyltransferase
MIDKTRVVRWNNVDFLPLDDSGALKFVTDLAAERSARHVHLCNSWTVVMAEDDERLKRALRDDLAANLVDGVPLGRLVASVSRRRAVTSRGPTLFDDAVPQLSRLGIRQTLFGGTNDLLDSLGARLESQGVSTEKIARIAPPFRPLDTAAIDEYVREIESTSPDIVWLGLGTPKQDILAAELVRELGCPVVCVGAAFDFAAGKVESAPKWLQGSGFEWLYRFAREPARLWRRYTWGNIRFVMLALSTKTKRP